MRGYYRLKRSLIERDAFISVVCFGLMTMMAELSNALGRRLMSIVFWGLGLVLLIGIIGIEWFLGRRRRPIQVPILFTVEPNRDVAQGMFRQFIQDTRLDKFLQVLQDFQILQERDLLIQLNRLDPRRTGAPNDWESAWKEILKEWESEVDRRIIRSPLASEGWCYHLHPHLWLPLAMALGASVGLRRSCVLYHRQSQGGQDRYFRVLDLQDPRRLLEPPPADFPPPRTDPPTLDGLPQKDRLILHVLISPPARHRLNFRAHPDHASADNVGIFYGQDLDPQTDWLPYVQAIVQVANPLIDRYMGGRVDVCVITPSAVAFALGMAMSRKPWVVVCDFFNNRYQPVFEFRAIEARHPFS